MKRKWVIACIVMANVLTPVVHAATDWSKASIQELRRAAEQGNASAQHYLGKAYEDGKGVAKNYSNAVNWYRKAAKQGNAAAQDGLGYLYDFGYGVPLDHVIAAKWYRKAAEQGNVAAMYNLADDYANGTGVPKNFSQSFKWYRKAARRGDADSEAALASMYADGIGTPRDYSKAVKWMHKAAKQGNATGQAYLALAYAYGMGVPKDYFKAVKWARKSAEQGNAYGEYELGAAYANGQGVPKDYAEALEWYRKSAAKGNAAAKRYVVITEKLLQTAIRQSTHGPLYVVKWRTFWVYISSSGLCVPAAAFEFKNVGQNALGTLILSATFTNPAKKRVFASGQQWVNNSGTLPKGYTLATMVYGTTGYYYSLGNCLKTAPKLDAYVTAQVFDTGDKYRLLSGVPVTINHSPYTYYSDQPMDGWVRNIFKTH